MKSTILLATLTALIATSSFAEAAPNQHPVAWEQVKNKDAYYWKFYSAPAGTDLRTIKPKYHKCHVAHPAQKDYMFQRTFEHNKEFEFQQFKENSISVNCIDCSPPSLGNYYLTKITDYITCSMYEDTPIE